MCECVSLIQWFIHWLFFACCCYLVAQVGEVEGGLSGLAFNAGHKHAYFSLRGDGIDVDDIVWAGFVGGEVGVESQRDVEAIGVASGKCDRGQGTNRKLQGWVVDGDFVVGIGEALFVEARELVGLGMSLAMGIFGEAALQQGTIEGCGLLGGLEEGALAQLRFRLAVVKGLCLTADELLAEAGVIYQFADFAGIRTEGWVGLCHSVCC